jgi:hypothetical protein
MLAVLSCGLATSLVGCGDDGSGAEPDAGSACPMPPPLPETGSDVGHAAPLGAGPGEARAGRISGDQLPPIASGLLTWADGDFVLANDKVAIVIEDVGDSELYDPWGGRPVGMARVSGGALIEPADFGEFFILTGRATVMTTSVTVINDGSDGNAAVVRAAGPMAPLPFFNAITGALFGDGLEGIHGAIDYTLEPGAEHVDITFRYASHRKIAAPIGLLMHGFMFTKRTPGFVPGVGFGDQFNNSAFFALVDDDATSWAYQSLDGPLGSGISASGFVSGFTEKDYTIPGCGEVVHPHARIIIGGPGLDGVLDAEARLRGAQQRAISGTVRRGGQPAAGVKVHATDAAGVYLTRGITGADGSYTLHVPTGTAVKLTASRNGDAVVNADVAADVGTADLALPALGFVHVVVTEPGGAPLPARVQILPRGQNLDRLPGHFGDGDLSGGRLHVAYPVSGDVTLPVPPGDWKVVVSRGYEYDLVERDITVGAGATVLVEASPLRVVDTTGVLCGDFHIHTILSNDSADDGLVKLASAVADGLELPVRSDHEYVGDFREEIEELGVAKWANGFGSVELTSMEIWGHMGVFPLVPDATKVNRGTPLWQSFPTADDPGVEFKTLPPPTVFDQVRARPEAPVIIINHPRGPTNYFGYVGFDPATGGVDRVPAWDTKFTLVEVFNDSGWKSNRGGTVTDWFALLKARRKVFAVGSSDTHGISGSPVGYPRTCIRLGTDDPQAVTASQVRDQLAAGHTTISGGVYVDARLGDARPGDTAAGQPATVSFDVKVQAARWVDVDSIDVVVDGETVDTIAVGDRDPVVRWDAPIEVQVGPGSFVVFAAYGDRNLDPVHPGRAPFGVTNPIFIE